jgi:hypothetical protein
MGTIPGALLMVATTPYGRHGPVWDGWRRYWGKPHPSIMIWNSDSRSMNPSLPEAVVAAAYAEDPVGSASEYGGAFRSDVDALLSREAVEALVPAGVRERPPLSGGRHWVFVDPSGGQQDSMTLAVAHAEGKLAVLDCLREVRPPFSPEAVVGEFSEVAKSYGCREVVGDRYSAQFVQELFRKQGVSYKVSDKTKSEIYLECLPMFNSGGAELLDSERLVVQLCGLERRTARGTGRDSVDHGPKGMDDLANAACGALALAVGVRRETWGADDFEIHRSAVAIEYDRRRGVPLPDWTVAGPG